MIPTEVQECLPKRVELIYIDYRDSLDNSLNVVQEAIQLQDLSPLYEEIDEWFIESSDYGVDGYIDELKRELSDVYDEPEDVIDEHRDEIIDYLYEHDESTPLHDLFRNTSDVVCFYDTGLEIDSGAWSWDKDELQEQLDVVKSTLQIETNKYDDRVTLMLMQASYGGRLVIYFLGDLEQLCDLKDANTIHFTNPAIAIIDTCNGSGDDTSLPEHTIKLELIPTNIFIDKTIKYSYTYEVCGMFSSWCECTDVKFTKEDNSIMVTKSTLHNELAVEQLYKDAYKAGKCTAGDMDMKRHRNTYYINDFPCGTKCPSCGTFWID